MNSNISHPADDRLATSSSRRKHLASTTALGTIAGVALCLMAQPAFADCIDDGAGHVDCAGAFAGYSGSLAIPTTVTIAPGAASSGTITLSGDAAGTVSSAGSISTDSGGGVAITSNAAITVGTTGAVSTGGANAPAIFAQSGSGAGGGGDISIAATDIVVSGPGSSGIDAQTYGAGSTTTVTATSVASTNGSVSGGGGPGSGSYGVIAYAQSGAVSVTTGTVTSHNSAGIFALGGGDSVSVDSGSVTVTGDGFGISDIAFGGAANVASHGSVSVQGDGFFGIYAYGASGVTVTGGGNIATSGANSIGLFAASPTGDIDIAAGTVTTVGDGSIGISASTPSGAIAIATQGVTTGGAAATAISVTSNGAIKVAATGPVSTSGATAPGIFAHSGSHGTGGGGDISIAATDVVVSGPGSTGIDAQTYGAGSMTTVTASKVVSTNGSVTGGGGAGSGSYGVIAYAQSGAVSVTTGTVTTHDSAGIFALGGGDSVSVDSGSVTVTGDGFGISDIAFGGTASVASHGPVSVQGDGFFGIYAYGVTGVSVSGGGGVATSGANSIGLFAGSPVGNVDVDVGAVTTTGDASSGVIAIGAGDVTVSVGSVSVKGAGATGISATGVGSTSVTVGAASALDSPAVVATSTGGVASVTLNGATTTGSGPAVSVSGATTASLALGTNGTLGGAGAQLSSASGSSVTNGGTVTGDAITPVLTALGGPLRLANSGTFTGLVGFTDGDDRVANSGTYRLLASQDFGGGSDSFANSGTLLVAPTAASATRVTLSHLEAFSNGGLVDLRNGHVGDVLAIPGSFTGSGASALALDVAFGATGAATVTDMLAVGGVIGGSTRLVVQRVGANTAVLDPGTAIATGAIGSAAGAFQLSSADQGLVHLGVGYDAATGTYSLVATPGDAVYHMLKIGEGAQQLWHSSAESWSSHMANLNDAHFAGQDVGGRLWGQFYGAAMTRKDGATFSAFGQSRAVDLSYRQDAFGGQFGLDLASSRGGAMTFGVTGGYLDSHVNFRGSSDRLSYKVANIGAYANMTSGMLFANLLGKYDRVWARAKDLAIGYDSKVHGSSYGVVAEAGVRLGGEGGYAEPLVSLSYVRTDIGSVAALGQTIDLDALNGLRGKAGLRAGVRSAMGQGMFATVYGQAAYVHDFKGTTGITFASGGQSLAYRGDPIGDHAEARIGVAIASPGAVTGFLEGFGSFAGQHSVRGGGGRVGLKMRF